MKKKRLSQLTEQKKISKEDHITQSLHDNCYHTTSPFRTVH